MTRVSDHRPRPLAMRIIVAVGVAALLAGGAVTATTAGADVDLGPDTTNVAVSGTTVTATITPSISSYNVVGAEYFLDSVGADGTSTPMTVTGATATGTLPTLTVGSTHTVYVHGEDDAGFGVENDARFGVWGPTASATFRVGTTNVTTDLGTITVTLNAGTYTSTLAPTDPFSPRDSYKLFASVKPKSVTTTLGFTRVSLTVAAGRIDFDTNTYSVNPVAPADPYRVLVTTLVATNGLKYKAKVSGLVTNFLPPNPV